jgi:hypothetical protein
MQTLEAVCECKHLQVAFHQRKHLDILFQCVQGQ